MYKDMNIWDHFDNINDFKVLCKHCGNEYCYNGNRQNLRQHVVVKHLDKLGMGEYAKLSCKVLWQYFTKTGDDKVAACNFCDKTFSYKTTVTNLKVHLSRCHTYAYLGLVKNLPPERIDGAFKHDEDSNDSGHQSSDVWSYFEQETGGRVRCVVCRASRPSNVEDLRKHIAEKHPTLLNGISQDAAVTDESGNEDDGTYTEVIYLEEDTKKKQPKFYLKEPMSRSLEPKKTKKVEKRRRTSASSDDMPIKRKKGESSDELDTFLTYIKCLLRQVPNEVCTKLQLDIVNLIMKAKLSRSAGNDSVVLENVREVNVERSDVISVALADADIAPEAVEHCYNELKE